MVNFISFLILSHFTILGINEAVGANLFGKVTLTVKPDDKPPIIVNLIETESFLANENIPMWIGRESLIDTIDSKKVMIELGPFTMYQDHETSSAAVYFHKRHEFDGLIDHRYYIKNLSINDRHRVLQVDKGGPIYARPITGHFFGKKTEKHLTQMLNQLRGKSDKQIAKQPELNITLNPHHPSIVYIETMILINYDMVEQLQLMSHDEYTPIISYLLTLFNGVDMLYSKVKNLKIKFNIAGLIIGTNRKSFFEMIKCYRQTNAKNWKIPYKGILDYMDAYCTVNATNDFLTKIWKLIPRDSYDIAIFLTRFGLFVNEYNPRSRKIQFVKLGGSARRYPTTGYHECRVNGSMYVPTTSISDVGNFGSFPVIVHETAHLFGVKHDELPLHNGEVCTANIMKATVGYCTTCLSWSNASTHYMHTFFSSRDRCEFINKPRSLRKPGPQKIWTVDQQCQCYGHEPPQKSLRKSLRGIWMGPNLSCVTNLQCEIQNGSSIEAPIPMDGTPCGGNKVCWNKNCGEIEQNMMSNTVRSYKKYKWESTFYPGG